MDLGSTLLVRVIRWSLSAALAACAAVACSGTAHAQARIEGAAPDVEVAGGVGLGLNGKIDNYFLGRLRTGALYAFEPHWIAGGFVLEAGALSGLAIGGQLEWNEFHGFFANAGLTYSNHELLTAHACVGYTIVGLEYQHGFGERDPSEALFLNVRFPLGFWWFTSGREKRPFGPPSPPPATKPVERNPPVRAVGPPPPSAAGGAGAAASVVVDPQTHERLERSQHALDEATLAGLRADYAAQSDALRRAYGAQPDPLLLIRVADAEMKLEHRASAAEALQRFLASTAASDTPALLAERPGVERRLAELMPQLARLRVSCAAARGDEQVEVDGLAQPGALLGYDVLVDPGEHRLTLQRGELVLLEQPFAAQPGEVVRLELQLPP